MFKRIEELLTDVGTQNDKLADTLDGISNTLNHIQSFFYSKNVTTEFCYKTTDTRDDFSWYLSWEKADTKSQNFRLFLKNDEGFKRPLVECNVYLRMRFFEHLEIFLDMFADAIFDKKNELDKQLEKYNNETK